MPPEIKRLAPIVFLSNPKEVTVSAAGPSAGTNIVQGLVVVPEAREARGAARR